MKDKCLKAETKNVKGMSIITKLEQSGYPINEHIIIVDPHSDYEKIVDNTDKGENL